MWKYVFLRHLKHTKCHYINVIHMFIFWYGDIHVHCIYRKFLKLLTRKRLFHINQTRVMHTSVFQPLKLRVTLFHFLSMLFLDCCICVQNNKLHDAVLVRGNAEPPSQLEEMMFSTCCGFFCCSLCGMNTALMPRSTFRGTHVSV